MHRRRCALKSPALGKMGEPSRPQPPRGYRRPEVNSGSLHPPEKTAAHSYPETRLAVGRKGDKKLAAFHMGPERDRDYKSRKYSTDTYEAAKTAETSPPVAVTKKDKIRQNKLHQPLATKDKDTLNLDSEKCFGILS